MSSLYLIIFESQQSSVIDLLEVFEIKDIIGNLVKSFENVISTTEDSSIKIKNELLRDLGNRVIAMIDNIEN